MEEHRIPDPDSELLERKVLADARIQEILTETKDSDKSFAAYFHTLFSILTTEDAAEFYHAFGDGYADSFADPKSQAKETALPANCADALRLLVRECADCRTLAEHTTWMSGRKGVYAFGGDLIYKELALEVCNYVNEVLEDRPGAVDLISDAVILEMIASMHQSYVNEYIEYRYDRIFSTSEFEETPGFGLSAVTDGAELWDMMCSCPENFYCGFPFDPDAHTHVMQKIEEHPEENRYAEVIDYLMQNASGQTVGFNGNVVKLPFFLKALSGIHPLPFTLSFYPVEYHPALYLQGYGGLYTKLDEAFIAQRRSDALLLQKYLPADRIRKQIQSIENRRDQGLETLHIVKL